MGSNKRELSQQKFALYTGLPVAYILLHFSLSKSCCTLTISSCRGRRIRVVPEPPRSDWLHMGKHPQKGLGRQPDTTEGLPTVVQPAYEAAAERRMLRAGAKLLSTLLDYKEESLRYLKDPSSCLEMDEVMANLVGRSRQLEEELILWHQAIGMIEENTQISPKSARGVAWKPYLSPRWLQYFADLAKSDDPGYLPQLADLLASEAARELDAECGRPTKAGTPCLAIPVYWPGRGRKTACARHLTPEEKLRLEEIWSDIEGSHSCPGCLVAGGQPCSETAELKVRANGQWPRIRSFAGRKMHDSRLELGIPAS
ncbi:hypothetical protein J3D46_002845 [Paenarthrobacter sp. A20]|nr:hypothetical protein [Paenarthrobacter sp. A20]